MDSSPLYSNELKLKSKLLFLSTFLTFFSYTFTQKCRTYTCSNTLEKDICLRLNYTSESESVYAKGCENSLSTYCPAYKLASNSEVKCEEKPKLPLRQYPGGPCKSKDDCMNSAECSREGFCTGKPQGLNCTGHDECLFGLACYKKANDSASASCNALRALNSQNCQSEFECSMGQGCFAGNCTDYYSQPDGTNLGASKFENSHSFCASGHDRHGICDSLKNINENEVVSNEPVKCDEMSPCRYASSAGAPITETNVCSCGKSSDSTRSCPIYGGNKYYKAAVKQIKEIINANRTNCNTVERDGVCNFYKSSASNDAVKITYETLKTKIAYYHEFANAQECIQKIFYPLYNKDYDKQPVDPVDPSGKQCPLFRCNSDDNSARKICAKNSFDAQVNKTFVDLFKKSCEWENEFCQFNRNYFSVETIESLCSEKDSKKLKDRYPGESCVEDANCFLLNGQPIEGLGKCLSSKICSGYAAGVNCTHTSQCNSGFYCKKDIEKNSTTCQSQESEKAACVSTFDCKNNLICYNNLCANVLYSLNAGEKVNAKNYTNEEKNLAGKHLCKFGKAKQLVDESLVCLMNNQTDVADSKQGNLVPCVPEQMCNFTLTDGQNITEAFTLSCECGYNPKGKGFCKAGNNISKFNFNFLVFH